MVFNYLWFGWINAHLKEGTITKYHKNIFNVEELFFSDIFYRVPGISNQFGSKILEFMVNS